MKRLTFFKIKRYFSHRFAMLSLTGIITSCFYAFVMTRLASYSKSFDLILK